MVNWLASPALLFYLLPPLIILVTAGTVAQKYIGLYKAEELFFSSFVYWLYDLIPLPGGYTLMGVLGIGLTLKFLLKSKWTYQKAGINLAHFGVLVLLIGGLVSSLLSEDGFASIAEGTTTQQVRDYHTREVLVLKQGQIITRLPASSLKAGLVLSSDELPFRLQVRDVCQNCSITQRSGAEEDFRSMAKGMQLGTAPLEKEDEANTGGLTFTISGLNAEQNGTYILFEDGPVTELGEYSLTYTKQLRELPFKVQLVDFVKTNYPGTETAKDYHSDVIIQDGAFSWPARIAMNAPLRYRGYTLYQSSFLQTADGQEISVLAISRDQGQYLPYVGTILMALGLLLHLFLRGSKVQP